MSATAFFTALSGSVIPLLSDSAVKGSAILLLATAAVMTLRGRSAATKHVVWLFAFVLLLVLPILSAVLPRLPLVPQWNSPQPSSNFAFPVEFERSRQRNTGSEILPRALSHDSDPSAEPIVRAGGVAKSREVASPTLVNGWHPWIPLIWAAGAIMLLMRLLASHLVLRHAANRCVINESNEFIRSVLADASAQLGITRRIVLLLDDERTIPLVWGIFRPRLLLPIEALRWSPEQLQSVLLHELAHIRRRDPLAQWLVQIVCAIQWFNPFVWFAARRLNAEAERACDDLVLSGGVPASAYAEHLLQVASRLSPARWASAGSLAMARQSSLEGRLLAVLDAKLNRGGLTPVQTLTAGVLAMALGLPIAMLHAADENVPAPGQSPLKQREMTSLVDVKTTADSAEFSVEQRQGAIALIAGEGPAARVVVHEFGSSGGSITFKVSADDRQGKWWDQVRIVRDTEGESLFPELPGEWLPRGRIAFLSTPVKRVDGAMVFAEIESAAGKIPLAARGANAAEVSSGQYRKIPRTNLESLITLDCRIHALASGAPDKAVILPVMAAADLTGPPRSAISYPYITLKPGFPGSYDRMAGKVEVFKVTATRVGRGIHVEGSALMQFVDGKYPSAKEAVKKTEESLDADWKKEPGRQIRAEFSATLGSNDALVVPIASDGLFPETLVASMTARTQRLARVRWQPPEDRGPIPLDGWVFTWPRSEHDWFASTLDYDGLPTMIMRYLEARKRLKPNSVTSEAVGMLNQDEVKRMVEEFRKRPGTRVDRVEPFSAKQNVIGFPRTEDRTHFDAAGERASVLPTTDERHISLNLMWEEPVLHHMSAPDGYGLNPGTSLCVLLPGPADPETIRMLVLHCESPEGAK